MATDLAVLKCNYGTYTAGASPVWTGLNIADASLYSAATAGNEFINDGRTFFLVQTGVGTACTVTFKKQIKNDEGFLQDLAMTVVIATGRKIIGPFNTKYNDSAGKVQVTYSATTNVLVAPISLAESGA